MAKIVLQATAIAVLAFMLALVCLTIWQTFRPASPKSEPHELQHSDAQGEHAKEHKSFIEKATDDPVALFTLCLTVFTALLAVFTLWMADSTKDLRDFAEEQARDMKIAIFESRRSANAATIAAEAAKQSADLSMNVERARLNIYDVTFRVDPDARIIDNTDNKELQGVRADFRISNVGRTPAMVMTTRLKLEAVRMGSIEQRMRPPTLSHPYRGTYYGGKILNPTNDLEQNPISLKSTGNFELKEFSKHRWFLHGEVVYRDVFGSEYVQYICYSAVIFPTSAGKPVFAQPHLGMGKTTETYNREIRQSPGTDPGVNWPT